MKRNNKRKLELTPVTIRVLAMDKLPRIAAASGDVCTTTRQSTVPTVSSAQSSCR
jgi:hypothetical protein